MNPLVPVEPHLAGAHRRSRCRCRAGPASGRPTPRAPRPARTRRRSATWPPARSGAWPRTMSRAASNSPAPCASRPAAGALVDADPTRGTRHRVGSAGGTRVPAAARACTTPGGADARQVQFHYDVSDEFYALWLDPRRVYSCAYWRAPAWTSRGAGGQARPGLPQADAAPGERFLDVGAGWGGLLLWAAEHYGVEATASRSAQPACPRQPPDRGARPGRAGPDGAARLPRAAEDRPFDKIASIGMFEHVGRARLPAYFAKLRRLLEPGGLLMNHGITAGGTRNASSARASANSSSATSSPAANCCTCRTC